ncbi:lysozyme inhibitor LprI family protein [Methylophaga sp.]|uniref:lysozyme inhibitor LprI family protein n=1 Tax=Methylophaga sp. TaxID=2024840 RepID=UPI003F69CD24
MIFNAMKSFVLLIILLFPFQTQAKPLCPQSNTTVEMNQCLNHKLERAVNALKNNLDLTHIRYADNKAMLKTIDDAQAAWETFRKKQCQSIFLLWEGGSIQSLMTVSCSIQLARERNQFLRDTYLTPH